MYTSVCFLQWCFMLIDDIPVRGFIGRLEEGNFIPHVHKVLFFTHHVFNIEYNRDQVAYACYEISLARVDWFYLYNEWIWTSFIHSQFNCTSNMLLVYYYYGIHYTASHLVYDWVIAKSYITLLCKLQHESFRFYDKFYLMHLFIIQRWYSVHTF